MVGVLRTLIGILSSCPAVTLLAFSLLCPAVGDWSTVVFDTPTVEPAKNSKGLPIISGGMPIGNGETTALVFPVTKAINCTDDFVLREGVHVWLSMATAMASDTALMPLGVVSIETEPPLASHGFRQTLSLVNATVEVSTSVGSVAVWVDARANRVVASVRGNGVELAARVTVQSLRPKERFEYYGRCSKPTSAPDEWSHPAGTNSIGLSHRNLDSDIAFLHEPGTLNATLVQQGLGDFVEQLQTADRWRHRQFGLVVSSEELQVDPAHRGQLAAPASQALDITITTLAKQTRNTREWQEEVGDLHRRHTAQPLALARGGHENFWAEFWNKSHIWVAGSKTLDILTQRYAQTRYVEAIQAGTWVPIKFNGMLFTAQLPPESSDRGPSYRDWGSCNWWQNLRLAYWNMFASADFEALRNLFDYYLQMVDFLRIRTRAAFNHSGIYVTETTTLFGAYDPCDYGTAAADRAPSDLNFGYQESVWLRFDFGGDGGLPELCVMLLDYYLYTLDKATLKRYLPLLEGTLEFFSAHYGDVEAKEKTLKIFPTQALETYQCPKWPATDDNCPTNDHPTVAALHVLTERALELNDELTTPELRRRWRALQRALPPVPLVVEAGKTVVSPYETYPAAQELHNSETPELYSTHPFRYFTLGRSRQGRDIQPSIRCLEEPTRRTCAMARQNTGWTQGSMNAALLGRAEMAALMTLERAETKPAGYRFPAFAPHEQDYDPSEDHFANMNTALQLMLLSPGDDGLEAGGALLFPAWPCEWDVDFKLAAPRQTVVSGRFEKGHLQHLSVEPPERRAAIVVLPCQNVTPIQNFV